MDRDEPVSQRQFTSVHHGSCLQGGSKTAMGTFPSVPVSFPVVMGATALWAGYSLSLTQGFDMLFTGIFIREVVDKFNQGHSRMSFIICICKITKNI